MKYRLSASCIWFVFFLFELNRKERSGKNWIALTSQSVQISLMCHGIRIYHSGYAWDFLTVNIPTTWLHNSTIISSLLPFVHWLLVLNYSCAYSPSVFSFSWPRLYILMLPCLLFLSTIDCSSFPLIVATCFSGKYFERRRFTERSAYYLG